MIKKELEQKVDTLLEGYIKAELEKLNKGEIEFVNLKNVSLEKIEKYLDSDYEDLDLNGWQNDYWCNTDKYRIHGCMYDASVTIALKENN